MPTLGYLLKHAQLRFSEIADAALAPLGISGREAAVLRAISAQPPESQGEIARRMGVDRTTMVTLIDGLEAKELVRRRQDPGDRRRNVVELTDSGRSAVTLADDAAARAEREFLRPLPADEAERFRKNLCTLLGDNPGSQPPLGDNPGSPSPRPLRCVY
ncbi:MAG TPA: MarR family transcriptional regulator [Trebonia sp.]|nr:MarR family transcriptional regulator [Trebonia sp.]